MMGALERQLELVPEDVRARILLASMLPSSAGATTRCGNCRRRSRSGPATATSSTTPRAPTG